jgi:hypothetical protein
MLRRRTGYNLCHRAQIYEDLSHGERQYFRLSAVELAAEIRVADFAGRVDAGNPHADREIQPQSSMPVTVSTEQALRCPGRRRKAMRRRRAPAGALHVKDNLYVAASRTTFGSKLHEKRDQRRLPRRRSPEHDVIGRNEHPEFGWKGVTDNRPSRHRNPWNTSLTPGAERAAAPSPRDGADRNRHRWRRIAAGLLCGVGFSQFRPDPQLARQQR